MYLMDELPDAVGRPPTTVAAMTKFGASAVDSSNPIIKKNGEKILIRYYSVPDGNIDGTTVLLGPSG